MPRLICHKCGLKPTPDATFGGRCPKDGSALVNEDDHKKAPKDTILGRVIGGKYPVVGLIGAGGMGAVYKALQEPVGREVALKVIRNFGDDSAEAVSETLRARFFREAKVVAKLNNPATVALYDYGAEDDGVMYMVLEFVKGRRLSDVIRDEGVLAPDRAVAICNQVLNALAEAHALGLVHRDLKPDNIMLVRGPWGEEQAKVLDFGIAKVRTKEKETLETGTGLLLGTPLYMPPEQAMARGAEPRSDLYSLGVVLYEMLSGVPPFTAATVFEVLLAHREKPVPPFPPDCNVPPALEAAVVTAMAKEPEHRFADATAMATALWEAVPNAGDRGKDPSGASRIPTPPAMSALRQSKPGILNSPTQGPQGMRTPIPPGMRRSGPVNISGAGSNPGVKRVSASGASKIPGPAPTSDEIAGTAMRATPLPAGTPKPIPLKSTTPPVEKVHVQTGFLAEDQAAVQRGPGKGLLLGVLGVLLLAAGGGAYWYVQGAVVRNVKDIPVEGDQDKPPATDKPLVAAPDPVKPEKPEDPVQPPDPAVAEAGPDASVAEVVAENTPKPTPTPDPTPKHPIKTPDLPKRPIKVGGDPTKRPIGPAKLPGPGPIKKDPGMKQVEEGGYKATVF